jgi:hypothetical protein
VDFERWDNNFVELSLRSIVPASAEVPDFAASIPKPDSTTAGDNDILQSNFFDDNEDAFNVDWDNVGNQPATEGNFGEWAAEFPDNEYNDDRDFDPFASSQQPAGDDGF